MLGLSRGKELFQPARLKAMTVSNLYELVRVHDDGNEQGEDEVNEERYKGIQINSAKDPNYWALVKVQKGEGGVHVIPIYERKEAFRSGHKTGKLEVVRTKNSPASKHKAYINQGCTEKKSEDIRCCSLHC